MYVSIILIVSTYYFFVIGSGLKKVNHLITDIVYKNLTGV